MGKFYTFFGVNFINFLAKARPYKGKFIGSAAQSLHRNLELLKQRLIGIKIAEHH